MAEQADLPVAWWRKLGVVGAPTLVGIVLLIVLVAAADRSGLALDWSADRRFSLDPVLERIVRTASSSGRLELVAVWDEEQQAGLGLGAIAEALRILAAKVPAATHHRIDAQRQRPELEVLAKRIGEASAPAVYVVKGDRAVRVHLHAGSRQTLQRDLAAAVLQLTDPRPLAAIVTQGHGELHPRGGDDDGGAMLLQALRLAGFAVRLRDGSAAEAVPPDAVLVIPGPTAPLGAETLRLLTDHLRDGGGAVVLGDDRMPADLARALRMRGVLIGPAMPGAQTPRADLPRGDLPPLPAQVLFSLRYHQQGREVGLPHHRLLISGEQLNPTFEPTAAIGGGMQLLSPWTTPVEVVPLERAPELEKSYLAQGVPRFSGQPVLMSLPQDAWRQPRGSALAPPSDMGQVPPAILAWAVEYAADAASVRAGLGGRLAVWGSRQAASDGVLQTGTFANDRLLTGLVAWAGRRQPPSEIPPAELAVFRITASETTVALVIGLLVVVLPCLFLGAAMLAWWDRR